MRFFGLLRELKELSVELSVGAWGEAKRYASVWVALGVAIILIAIFITLPNDKEWVEVIASDRSVSMRKWARWLSHYGDFVGALAVAVFFAGVSFLTRRTHWRRVAWAIVLGASLSGLAANVGRFSVGRPRPVAKNADGIYGPSLDWKLHGFPSAHAATAMGTAGVVLAAAPIVGLPVLIVASGVVWSRIHRRRHHPTDVMAGSYLGLLFGVSFGLAARRRRR